MTELDRTEKTSSAATRTRESAAGSAADDRLGAAIEQDDPDAITLAEYAVRRDLDEQEVWRMLRRGEIIGRTIRGKLYIYINAEAAAAAMSLTDLDINPSRAGAEPDSSQMPQVTFGAEAISSDESPAEPELSASATVDDQDLADLPPLPKSQVAVPRPGATSQGPDAAGGFLSLEGQRSQSPEIALLLDHLSLAKEENREILRMAQESIRKVTELNDQILEMKDTVIEAKQAQLQAVEDRIDQLESKLAKVSQEKEDLEILAQTIAESKNIK